MSELRLDARKPLTKLREEWEACIRCELGTRRMQRDGHFVFGQGYGHSIMFIGEGPGAEEDACLLYTSRCV